MHTAKGNGIPIFPLFFYSTAQRQETNTHRLSEVALCDRERYPYFPLFFYIQPQTGHLLSLSKSPDPVEPEPSIALVRPSSAVSSLRDSRSLYRLPRRRSLPISLFPIFFLCAFFFLFFLPSLLVTFSDPLIRRSKSGAHTIRFRKVLSLSHSPFPSSLFSFR